METFEDLRDVIDTVAFDSEALVERVVAGGRRRQRRGRIGVGAAALAVGAVAVGAGLHSSGSTSAVDTPVATRATPSPTAQPSKGAGDGRGQLPTPQVADARLTERLPVPGDLVSASADHGIVVVDRTIDPDGAGPGSVILTLQLGPPLSKLQVSRGLAKCDRVAQVHAPSTCVHLADGWMFIERGRSDVEGASAGALEWTADVSRTDGSSATLRVTNYLDPGQPTRQLPPLTMDQAEHLATDPVWFEPAS